MKILHIIPRFTHGGAEHLILEQAKILQMQMHEVVVASVRGGGEMAKLFQDAEIETKVGTNNFQKNLKDLEEFIKKWQPDIIHSHVFSADVAAYKLKKKLKNINWLSTQHNLISEEVNFFRQQYLKIILKKADKVITVSEGIKKELEEDFFIEDSNIILLKNAIALNIWSKLNGKLFQNKKLKLATIGRLEKQKGHEVLLLALAQLPEIPLELHIFGDGSLKDKLQKRAKSIGIDKKIKWHGTVDNLPKFMLDIDIIVQPSLWEGMSLAIMESMAAGKVVIGTVAAGEDLIQNMKTGVVVPTEQAESLASAIRLIHHNRDVAKQIAKNAKKYAQDNFSLDKNIEELLKIYKQDSK